MFFFLVFFFFYLFIYCLFVCLFLKCIQERQLYSGITLVSHSHFPPWKGSWITFNATANDFSDPNYITRLFDTLKDIGTSSFSFNFIFPYIFIFILRCSFQKPHLIANSLENIFKRLHKKCCSHF